MESRMGRNLGRIVLSICFLFSCALSIAFGAEWQWTKGQGWSEGTGRARATPAEQQQYAFLLERKGEFYDAAKQYFLLIRVYPDSTEAGVALQRLAKCLFEMQDYYRSFKALEQVISNYPHSGSMPDLVAIEYKIGKKLQTGKYGRLLPGGDPVAESRKQALEVFEAVLTHDPYGPYADDSLIAMGDIQLLLKEPETAKKNYERLIREFPRSSLLDRARLGVTRADVMLGKATPTEVERMVREMRAKKTVQQPRQSEEEAQDLEESLNELEEIESAKMWKAAHVYFRRNETKYVKAGKFLLSELVRRYPKTSYASQARELLPQIIIPASGGFRLPKLNINPFAKPKARKGFQTPQLTSEEIHAEAVTEPIPGIVETPRDTVAHVEPKGLQEPERVQYDRGNGVRLNPGGKAEVPLDGEMPAILPDPPHPPDSKPRPTTNTKKKSSWTLDLDSKAPDRRSLQTQRQRPVETPPPISKQTPRFEQGPEIDASPEGTKQVKDTVPAKRDLFKPREPGIAGAMPIGKQNPQPGSLPVTPVKQKTTTTVQTKRPQTNQGGWKLSEDFE